MRFGSAAAAGVLFFAGCETTSDHADRFEYRSPRPIVSSPPPPPPELELDAKNRLEWIPIAADNEHLNSGQRESALWRIAEFAHDDLYAAVILIGRGSAIQLQELRPGAPAMNLPLPSPFGTSDWTLSESAGVGFALEAGALRSLVIDGANIHRGTIDRTSSRWKESSFFACPSDFDVEWIGRGRAGWMLGGHRWATPSNRGDLLGLWLPDEATALPAPDILSISAEPHSYGQAEGTVAADGSILLIGEMPAPMRPEDRGYPRVRYEAHLWRAGRWTPLQLPEVFLPQAEAAGSGWIVESIATGRVLAIDAASGTVRELNTSWLPRKQRWATTQIGDTWAFLFLGNRESADAGILSNGEEGALYDLSTFRWRPISPLPNGKAHAFDLRLAFWLQLSGRPCFLRADAYSDAPQKGGHFLGRIQGGACLDVETRTWQWISGRLPDACRVLGTAEEGRASVISCRNWQDNSRQPTGWCGAREPHAQWGSWTLSIVRQQSM